MMNCAVLPDVMLLVTGLCDTSVTTPSDVNYYLSLSHLFISLSLSFRLSLKHLGCHVSFAQGGTVVLRAHVKMPLLLPLACLS